MSIKIALHCLVLVPYLLLSQVPEDVTLIKRTDEKIGIDGVLNEKVWENAATLPLSYEVFPGNNLPAEVQTLLRIAFDNDYFYFSFEAFDPDPAKIRAIISDRDRLDDNDFITIFIDPFNDSRRAFYFSVNALGVQEDGLYDEQQGGEDQSWDAIWNSAGRINENGFIIEGAIPFKSLRFPNTDEVQTWRVFGRRVYPRSIKKGFTSMAIDQDNTCLLCQANYVSGIRGIKPGRNLEFTPTLTLNRFDHRSELPNGNWNSGKLKTNVGFDARWGITSDLTLNATINPDFSNVEADAAQLDVNNRFALQFPEKRPFFLEGADFFNTPIQVFFSRSIVEPTFGTKITGKVGKNAIGFLVAEDRLNSLILPGFQNSSSFSTPSNVVNVIGRYRRDVGANSNAGVLFTSKNGDGYYNQLAGFDGFIRPIDPLTIRIQMVRAFTAYDSLTVNENALTQSNYQGNSFNGTVLFDTRNWNSRLVIDYRDPGFRADAGFVPQVDFVGIRYWLERVYWPENHNFFANLGWNFGGFRRGSTSGQLDIGGGWISAFLNGPYQLNYWINPDMVWQQYQGKEYYLRRFWTGFDIQPLGNLGVNGWINLGPAVDFSNNQKADNVQFRLESDVRVGRHIDMTINHRYQKLQKSGQLVYVANLTQLQAAYNFNVRFFLRTILQYRHTTRNQLSYLNEVNAMDRSIFAQVLLSYKLNPQSVIFLGYIDNHQGYNSPQDFMEIPLTQINQTLFFKVGYAWRP